MKTADFGQVVWFDAPTDAVNVALWENSIEKKFRFIHPVQVGEALRSCESRRSHIRVENHKGNYAILWVDRPETPKVDAIHLFTYNGARGSVLAPLQIIVPKDQWTAEQKSEVKDFHIRTEALIGTIPAAKVSQNSIDAIISFCCASRLRRDGVIYFVPKQFFPLLEEYQKQVEKVGATVNRVDAEKTASSIRSVAQATKFDILDRMKLILEQAITQGEKGLKSRLVEIQSLSNLAEVYKEVLGEKLAEVTGQLDKAQKVVNALIDAQ